MWGYIIPRDPRLSVDQRLNNGVYSTSSAMTTQLSSEESHGTERFQIGRRTCTLPSVNYNADERLKSRRLPHHLNERAGSLKVDCDTQRASQGANEKRKRNAEASARWRERWRLRNKADGYLRKNCRWDDDWVLQLGLKHVLEIETSIEWIQERKRQLGLEQAHRDGGNR